VKTPAPLTLQWLNAADLAAFTSALGHVFEHSPWVAEQTWPRRPFRDAAHLHAELCATLRGAEAARQLALIRAHPDLAGRLAQAGQLTAESAREQAAAGLTALDARELAQFQQLNSAYRARFGFPFVICARLNDRATIQRALSGRMQNTPQEEHGAALAEIEKIAWLRLQDVLGTR
jgi:2-oxo-4-hydroxy-4-carboxy-5-ureidoimidazoline decarboxylase